MLSTLPEGTMRGIFAGNFTQASFRLMSNHGFPCREECTEDNYAPDGATWRGGWKALWSLLQYSTQR